MSHIVVSITHSARLQGGFTTKQLFSFLFICFCFFTTVSEASASSRIFFLFSDLADPFSSQLRTALETYLAESDSDPWFSDAKGSLWTQMDQVEDAIESGADLVCIQTCEYASLSAANQLLTPLESAGIPVIFFGRSIAGSEEKLLRFLSQHPACLYVNHDSEDIGRVQGKAIGEYLCAHYSDCDLNSDGIISYVMLQGDPFDTDAVNRSHYALETANEVLTASAHPPLQWYDGSDTIALADPQCFWSADFGKKTISDILRSFGPASGHMIELIICGNDDMANGCINALFHVDYNTDVPGDPRIPVFGVDGTLLAFELIEKERMTGTVMRSPDHMAQALISGISLLMHGTPIVSEGVRTSGSCIFPAYAYCGNP